MKLVWSALGAAASALMLVAASPAASQDIDPQMWLDHCNGVGEPLDDLQIGGCSALINTGWYPGDRGSLLHERRGRLLMAYMDYAGAAADWSAILAVNEQDADAYQRRAEAHLMQAQYAKALADIERYLAAKPNDAGGLAMRCHIRVGLGRELDAAVRDCDRAIALAPNVPAGRFNRGLLKLRLGQFAGAVADFDAAGAGPENGPAQYGRGIARLALGQHTEGETDLAAARRTFSGVDRIYGNLGFQVAGADLTPNAFGEAITRHGRWSYADQVKTCTGTGFGWSEDAFTNALAACVAALRSGRAPSKPALASLVAHRSYLAYRLRVTGALAEARHAVEVDPANPLATALVAFARPEIEREQARVELDRAVTAAPDDVHVRYLRVWFRSGNGADSAGAISDLDALIRRAPENAALYAARGELLASIEAWPRAIADYDRAAALEPTAVRLNGACWTRAQANRELARALADCERALQLEPDTASTLDSRALVKLRMGDLEGSSADYQAAAELGLVEAAFGRGVVLVRMGREADGRAAMAVALQKDAKAGATFDALGLTP